VDFIINTFGFSFRYTQEKRRTGIEGDIDLIAFALANVALQDNFAQVFKDARGKVDADLKLGF
jgi:hypothetical protein